MSALPPKADLRRQAIERLLLANSEQSGLIRINAPAVPLVYGTPQGENIG